MRSQHQYQEHQQTLQHPISLSSTSLPTTSVTAADFFSGMPPPALVSERMTQLEYQNRLHAQREELSLPSSRSLLSAMSLPVPVPGLRSASHPVYGIATSASTSTSSSSIAASGLVSGQIDEDQSAGTDGVSSEQHHRGRAVDVHETYAYAYENAASRPAQSSSSSTTAVSTSAPERNMTAVPVSHSAPAAGLNTSGRTSGCRSSSGSNSIRSRADRDLSVSLITDYDIQPQDRDEDGTPESCMTMWTDATSLEDHQHEGPAAKIIGMTENASKLKAQAHAHSRVESEQARRNSAHSNNSSNSLGINHLRFSRELSQRQPKPVLAGPGHLAAAFGIAIPQASGSSAPAPASALVDGWSSPPPWKPKQAASMLPYSSLSSSEDDEGGPPQRQQHDSLLASPFNLGRAAPRAMLMSSAITRSRIPADEDAYSRKAGQLSPTDSPVHRSPRMLLPPSSRSPSGRRRRASHGSAQSAQAAPVPIQSPPPRPRRASQRKMRMDRLNAYSATMGMGMNPMEHSYAQFGSSQQKTSMQSIAEWQQRTQPGDDEHGPLHGSTAGRSLDVAAQRRRWLALHHHQLLALSDSPGPSDGSDPGKMRAERKTKLQPQVGFDQQQQQEAPVSPALSFSEDRRRRQAVVPPRLHLGASLFPASASYRQQDYKSNSPTRAASPPKRFQSRPVGNGSSGAQYVSYSASLPTRGLRMPFRSSSAFAATTTNVAAASPGWDATLPPLPWTMDSARSPSQQQLPSMPTSAHSVQAILEKQQQQMRAFERDVLVRSPPASASIAVADSAPNWGGGFGRARSGSLPAHTSGLPINRRDAQTIASSKRRDVRRSSSPNADQMHNDTADPSWSWLRSVEQYRSDSSATDSYAVDAPPSLPLGKDVPFSSSSSFSFQKQHQHQQTARNHSQQHTASASPSDSSVAPAGSGKTAAIEALIQQLKFRYPVQP